MAAIRTRTTTRCALALLAAFALASCASNRDAEVVDRSWEPRSAPRTMIPEPSPRRGASRDHVVVRGDTLHAIAFARGVSVRELAAWNALSPPYTIYPGQRLRVGAASTRAVAPAPARRYPVRPVQPIDRTAGRSSIERSASDRRTYERYPPPPPPRRGVEPMPAPRRAPLPPPQGTAITTPLDPGVATVEPLVDNAEVPVPPATAARAPAIRNAPTRSAGGIAWRWPADGKVSSRFRAGDPASQGVDIRGRDGDVVVAAADGEVVYSGNGLLGYGELIIVKHAGEYLSAYAYNRKRLVAEGERVRAGQPIAEMGRRGGSIDLVHFEIRRGGQPVDPLQFLPSR
ncbi:MAG TPA: peptidoglycan DD-metalloendopeptidase family protein [Candidatus Saccharimonadia bacterium]|nr:peptidoglycan DD-metalloendopeptidase family protein [Candidatus Saccharimonadia bacterium]